MSDSAESATTSEYLPPVLSKQPDSGNRALDQKTCLARHQFDYNCALSPRRSVCRKMLTGAGKGEAEQPVCTHGAFGH